MAGAWTCSPCGFSGTQPRSQLHLPHARSHRPRHREARAQSRGEQALENRKWTPSGLSQHCRLRPVASSSGGKARV